MGARFGKDLCRHGRARLPLPRRGPELRHGEPRRARRGSGAAARGGAARRRDQAGLPERGGNPRDEVKAHKLLEPFAALKFAAQQRKAEALSAKLCHTGDEFIYEITLLHRDGRLVHVQMEAATGKLIGRPSREPHETHETHERRSRTERNEGDEE